MGEDIQKDVQRLYAEYVFLRQLAETLNRNLTLLNNLLAEIRVTQEAIKEIEKISESNDVIVSIGGMVFLKARLPSRDRVLINIGSNVVVEKSHEEALEYLKNREENLKTELERTNNSYIQVLNRMRQLEQLLRQLSEKGRR